MHFKEHFIFPHPKFLSQGIESFDFHFQWAKFLDWLKFVITQEEKIFY